MSAPVERNSWWSSIVTRITVVFAVFVVISTVLGGFLVYRGGKRQMVEAAQHDMRRSLQLMRLRLSAFANTMADDIDFLAANEAARQFTSTLESPDSVTRLAARERMAVLMESFLQSRPHYSQVRVIGADKEGRELIRYDRAVGGVVRIGEPDLQAKGDRDYYQAAMRLFPAERYFSPIDLNREHGHVQVPIVPTLRAAAPLFTSTGVRVGIVVINADLRALYADLRELQGEDEALLLADGRGELLLHPDTARMFRFDRGDSYTLKEELATLPLRLDTPMTAGARMLRFEDAGVDALQRRYTLGIAVSLDGLLAGIRQERNRSLWISLAVAAVFAVFSLFFARSIARRLARIATRVERYAAGAGERLPSRRRDEIGRLSRSLEHMQERIDQRVHELEEARQRAEESDRVRREFLANMSHEVRTPLNAILGMAGEIEGAALAPGDQERLAIAKRSALRLKGLVDDLLLHARIGEGRLDLKPESTDLPQLLNDIAQSHRAVAEVKGVALRVSVDPASSPVWIDPLRLHQIADNLMGNAVKFTSKGQVDVKAWKENGEVAALHLQVSDTGPGLAAEERSRIFDRFERAASAENDRSGTGLGLAITRRLVELMGGSIEVQSTLGRGSTFLVQLPLTEAVAMAPPLPSVDPALVKGLRVLYVEDVESNRMVMRQWAERWKWDMEMAASSSEAIERAGNTELDLILLDLDLGDDMRGTELGLRLRGLKRHRFIPMLAVTAFVGTEQEEEILKAGINDRITKPVDPQELIARAAFWCGRDDGGPDENASLEKLEEQYDRDPARLITVMQQYRREFVQWRLGLRSAVEARNAEAIAGLRHKLKPHLQLLAMSRTADALDRLTGPDGAMALITVENGLRCCDRALMGRQRELQRVAAGPAA